MGGLTAVQADVYRRTGTYGRGPLVALLLRDRVFRMQCTLRLNRALAGRGPAWLPVRVLAKLAHRATTRRCAVDLPAATDIGPGLVVQHGWGLVVNPGATVGANVTLFHGVTLGQADRIAPDGTRTTGYPVVEDDVWIGPHAAVVGGVRVGRGSRIAAGAFVTRDVPPYSVVMGNPGTVVKSGCTPDVVNPVDLTRHGLRGPYVAAGPAPVGGAAVPAGPPLPGVA